MVATDTDRAAIGRRRAALRAEVGLTREALAARAGVSIKTLANAEDGQPLREESMAKLATALGVGIGLYADPPARVAAPAGGAQ